MKYYLVTALLVASLAGCMGRPPVEVPSAEVKVEALKRVQWDQVDGWLLDRPAAALVAFQKSCKAIGGREMWQLACSEADKITTPGKRMPVTFSN